jgi:hypothetical protein
MPIYTVKLLRKDEVAAGTMAFHFEKPARFACTAGQFGDFTLLHPSETDDEGNIRGFSLASAPCEPDLMIATRMRDTAFKRVLKRLPLGTPVKLDAPYGDFVLHTTVTTPVVFLHDLECLVNLRPSWPNSLGGHQGLQDLRTRAPLSQKLLDEFEQAMQRVASYRAHPLSDSAFSLCERKSVRSRP